MAFNLPSRQVLLPPGHAEGERSSRSRAGPVEDGPPRGSPHQAEDRPTWHRVARFCLARAPRRMLRSAVETVASAVAHSPISLVARSVASNQSRRASRTTKSNVQSETNVRSLVSTVRHGEEILPGRSTHGPSYLDRQTSSRELAVRLLLLAHRQSRAHM